MQCRRGHVIGGGKRQAERRGSRSGCYRTRSCRCRSCECRGGGGSSSRLRGGCRSGGLGTEINELDNEAPVVIRDVGGRERRDKIMWNGLRSNGFEKRLDTNKRCTRMRSCKLKGKKEEVVRLEHDVTPTREVASRGWMTQGGF